MSRSRLLLAPAVLTACTFTSVGPVGKAIDTTLERREALVPVSQTCWLGDATRKRDGAAAPKKDDAHPCEYGDAAKELDAALDELARYGKSLTGLAGKKDIDPSGAVKAAIDVGNKAPKVDISSGQKGGLAVASKLLAKAALTLHRRNELRDVLAETDRAVQCTAYRGLAAVGAFRRSARILVDLETDADALRYRPARKPGDPIEATTSPADPPPDVAEPDPEAAAPVVDTDASPEPLSSPWPELRERLEELAAIQRLVAERLGEHDTTLSEHDEKTYRTLAIAYRQAALTGARLVHDLEALERGYKATAVAHNTLACERKRLGTPEDRDLANEIAQAVSCVTGEPEKADGLDDDDRRELAARCKAVREHAAEVETHACEELQAPGEAKADPEPLPPMCPDDDDASSTTAPKPAPPKGRRKQ